jgi:RsmE family RNA methyltransferase
MNLLLLRQEELGTDQRVTLRDRRARHLLEVLGVTRGRSVRAGLIDGPLGAAEVVACGTDRVVLQCRFEEAVPARPIDVLLLAVPRPKVLRRCLSTAAALGFGRIVLFRSWRVDKSHLGSRELDPDRLERHLLEGLEQGCRTHRPALQVAPRFRPFIEDELPSLVPAGNRFVASPDAPSDFAHAELAPQAPIALVVGPERGLTEYEVGRFVEAGFRHVRAGRHPLRVETAIAFLHGHLRVLRTLAAGRNDAGNG